MALNLEGDPGECGVEPSEVATGRHGGAAAALGSGRTRLASRMTFSDLDTSTTDRCNNVRVRCSGTVPAGYAALDRPEPPPRPNPRTEDETMIPAKAAFGVPWGCSGAAASFYLP